MAAALGLTMAAAALPTAREGGGPRQSRKPVACFPVLLLLTAAPYLVQVSALEVYTPPELFVANGTEATLSCTFTSTEVISSAASVTWSFQGEGSSSSVSFFYYGNGKPYLGKNTQFKDRSSWAGDLNKKDASIIIANMGFQDNGTYICDVKNPPDIDGIRGEIKVRVVEKKGSKRSVFLILGVITAGILALILLIMLIVCIVNRKKNSKKHYSGCSTSESLVSSVKQAPRKTPSDTVGLVNSMPVRSHQGPVIYAQLDHSGGQYSDKINKSESVVYADIRKN